MKLPCINRTFAAEVAFRMISSWVLMPRGGITVANNPGPQAAIRLEPTLSQTTRLLEVPTGATGAANTSGHAITSIDRIAGQRLGRPRSSGAGGEASASRSAAREVMPTFRKIRSR
jgi:hypothetical protein